MHVLRMLDASYTRRSESIVPSTTLRVEAGERVTQRCASALGAEALAMMGAALLRPTSGSVLIGEYDPRVQPVHCKRIAAFVPHDPLPLASIDTRRFIDYRAALWEIDPAQARARAKRLLERLTGIHEAFAYPIVAALLPHPQLLILDRPQPATAERVNAVAGDTAVLCVYGEPQ